MAKTKERFFIGMDKPLCYEITADPKKPESSSDIIGFSVSNAATNEFYYDEDFAVPFDANLTDGQVAPLDDSLLLYLTTDGVSGASQCSEGETTLSPYRTVIDLSDSDPEMEESLRRVSSSSSEGGSENYWGTDSRLLRGCGISVEGDQLGVHMERSGEGLDRSSDSLAEEVDCNRTEARLTTWAEVGTGFTKSLNKKPEVNGIMTSNSSEELDQCDNKRLITWASLDKEVCHDPVGLEDGLKRVNETVDSLETRFMQSSGFQLGLASGLKSFNESQLAKDSIILSDSQSQQVPLAAGMTTWRTLMTSYRRCDGSPGNDDIKSTEEWPNYPTSPKREESISSPSSKDDGYDSVTKDLSMNDSQSIEDSDEVQTPFASEEHQFEGLASGGDSVDSTVFSGVELPEILRQALQDSHLHSTTFDIHPYRLLEDSLASQHHAVGDEQQHLDETVDHLLQGRGVRDGKGTRSTGSLNSTISSSFQQSVVAPVLSVTENCWPYDAGEKPSMRKEQQWQETHTLPKESKRTGGWNRAADSYVLHSLMRPLPDLGFLRKSTRNDDGKDKQDMRVCSEIVTGPVDSVKKQAVMHSESSHLEIDKLRRGSRECSSDRESHADTGYRGNSSQVRPTLSGPRSRNSDYVFSALSSASSGIDPGMAFLDDGYGTWSSGKSALKTQNQLAEPWNLAALQRSGAKSGKEFDLKGEKYLDVDRRKERLVVKVCNTCNIRTVQLEDEKQTSQRSFSFPVDCKAKNSLSPPPKIIVSSADSIDNKKSAFGTNDLTGNFRFWNTVLDKENSRNNNKIGDIRYESIRPGYKENTDTTNTAFDSVNISYDKKPCHRNLNRDLVSDDRLQTDLRLNDHSGIEVFVNCDNSRIIIDGREGCRQQLTNSITREQELDVQHANTNVLETVYVEFSEEKHKRIETHGKGENEIIQNPKAIKNVSILENGVRFRPGTNRSDECNASKTIRVASVDQEKPQRDVIGVWNSKTSPDNEEVSPTYDQPPVDFLISSDKDSNNDCKPSLTKKTDLWLNTMRSVETLLCHVDRNRVLKGESGNTQSDVQVGHLVLDHLCPAVLAILLDGLKPELQGLFGTVRNTVRQVIEDSATLGHPPNLVVDLVTSLKRLKFLNTSTLFFNAFVFALLNCKALDFWLSYVHNHAPLLQKHYTPESFQRLSHSTAHHTFEDLVAFLQPLALVPFRLEYNFEVKILERLKEGHRERLFIDRHLAAVKSGLGVLKMRKDFSNDERAFSGDAGPPPGKSPQYMLVEVNNEVGSIRRPLCAFRTEREDINEVGLSQRSSPEIVEARIIPRIEPHVIAVNHGAKYMYTPGYQNCQRNADTSTPYLYPGKRFSCNEQDNDEPRRVDSSALFAQHSNAATRTIWSDYMQRIGVVKDRLEKLVFGSS